MTATTTAAAAPLRLYGIANCDSVRRARAALQAAGVEHRFHDFRVAGLPPAAVLMRWLDIVGLAALVNRQGSTWRGLTADEQGLLQAAAPAGPAEQVLAVLGRHASVIKRPVVEYPGGAVTVGLPALLAALAEPGGCAKPGSAVASG